MSTADRFRWFHGLLLGSAAFIAVWVGGRFIAQDTANDGVDRDPVSADSPASASTRAEPGLIVESLEPGSAGASAGLQVGDRLVRANGQSLPSPFALQAVVENQVGGDPVILRLDRGEESLELRAPRDALRLEVRPGLPRDAMTEYEAGKLAASAGDAAAAASAWTRAAEAAARDGDANAAAWLFSRSAQTHESQRRWSDAAQGHSAALENAKQSGDTAGQSRTLVALSRCRMQLADAPAAIAHLEEAWRIDTAANRKLWEAADAHSLGTLTWSRGDLDSARRCFAAAVAVREQVVPDSVHLGDSLNGMGAVASHQGDLATAESFYRRSLAICERVMPDSLAVADGLNNLAVVAIGRGDLDTAAEYNARSLAIRERLAPDSEALTAALTNMGIVEYKRGHLQAAQDYYGRSLAINERLSPGTIFVARDYINLGVIAYDRGDLDAAQDYYSRGSTILDRIAPDSPDCMASVYNLGIIAADRGDWELAERNLERTLAYRERTAPDSLSVAEACNALGNLEYSRSMLDSAEAYYARALEIEERRAPDSLLVSTSLHNLGGVASRRGQFDSAKNYYTRALAIRERIAAGSLDLASTVHGLGDIALRQGRPADAVPLLLRALATIETQRNHISAIQSRAFLLARYSEPYVTLQRAYLALGDKPSAFDTVERARARSLLDGLGEARADIREGVDPALLAREQAVKARLSAIEWERPRSMDNRAADPNSATPEEAVRNLLVEYADIQGQIRRASPRYAALTQPQPSSVTEIQRTLLDDDTVLLEYSLGQEQSFLWLVTANDLHCYPLPGQDDLNRAARQVHELATARNRSVDGERVESRNQRVARADAEFGAAAAELSRMVLEPAAEHLGTKRLLIVADGALQYVPFGALPKPVSRAADATEDGFAPTVDSARSPLIVDHELVSLPSASVLALLRRELAGRAPAPRGIAVLADPVLQPSDPRVIARDDPNSADPGAAKPGAAPTNEAGDADGSRGVVAIRPAALQRLRYSRLEAERIVELAGEPGLTALDFAANKQTALNPELGEYRIVHLATHGLLDSQHPELSGIVLSLVDERGRAQDGFLRLHEIYNLRLNADLVVLSACRTALGREVRGEGLVGLTRGFMYAGAERVVASLWNVQDEATAELMTVFYQAMLRDGQTPAAALRTAQVSMWQAGKAPYYWAAFVLQGEYR